MGWRSYVKFKNVNKKINNMEKRKSDIQVANFKNQEVKFFADQEINNILSKRWFGYKLRLDIRSSTKEVKEIDFYINIKREKVDDLYSKIRSDERVSKFNFSGNPYEKNSFTELLVDDFLFAVQAPKGKNGDNDWAYYKNCIVPIIIYKKA
jgi:hypothetical protein